MEPITDEIGLKYFTELPESARLASISDFFDRYNNLKIGKYYLAQSHDELLFFVKRVHPYLTRENLEQYIATKQLYVSTNDDK